VNTYVKKKNACQASTPLNPGNVNVFLFLIVDPMTDNFLQSSKGAKTSQFFYTYWRENSKWNPCFCEYDRNPV